MSIPRLPLLSLALACALAAALLALPANAAGKWRLIPESGGSNLHEPGLLRTADGTLHVVYRDKRDANENFLHLTVNAAGVVGARHQVLASDWGSLTNPSVVRLADGRLAVFFSGLTAAPFNGKMAMATSADGGATWALHPGVVTDRDAYDSTDVGAAVAGDGTPFTSFSGTFGTYHHVGIDPAVPSVNHVGTQCCGYYTALATDTASGQVFMAWHQLVDGAEGHYWANASTGSAPVAVPASAAKYNGSVESVSPSQRASLVARAGGGTWLGYGVGYPSYKAAFVYRLGGLATRVHKGEVNEVALAKGPGGRLWLLVTASSGGGERVIARRSNPAVTAWGAPVSVQLPAKASAHRVLGEGSLGPLDVFAHLDDSTTNTWYDRLLPGLTVVPTPNPIRRGRTTDVTVKVTDAGAAVANAKVTIRGASAKTNTAGVAVVSVMPGARQRRVTVTATHPQYTPGAARVRTKRG